MKSIRFISPKKRKKERKKDKRKRKKKKKKEKKKKKRKKEILKHKQITIYSRANIGEIQIFANESFHGKERYSTVICNSEENDTWPCEVTYL